VSQPARPFRFALQAAWTDSRTGWVELARCAEAVGFAALLTPDHLDRCLSPLAPLVSAADATSALRVGTLVLNNDFRHPALLAREAATIDLLTGGRLELGLGAGHAWPEYERVGLRFDPPGVRVARLEESVGIVRRLLDGETVDHEGAHYRLRGEQCQPRPLQARVPVIVGGAGRRVLALAAQKADAVGLTGLGRTRQDGVRHELGAFTAAGVDEHVAWVRKQAGERFEHIELQALVQHVEVTDRARQKADEFARRFPELSAEDVLETPYVLIGSADALVEKLLRHRERWGISHYSVRPPAQDVLGPVVARLTSP
jgi:probable F420-dependent oxidoreductase